MRFLALFFLAAFFLAGCGTADVKTRDVALGKPTTDSVSGYTLTDLGAFDPGETVEANAINDHGQVVGEEADTPFLWQGGHISELTAVQGGLIEDFRPAERNPGDFEQDGGALAINDRGQVAGWIEIGTTGGQPGDMGPRHDQPEAVVWDGGPWEYTDGLRECQALAISSDGIPVGFSTGQDGVRHAVRWRGVGVAQDLGSLATSGGGAESEAKGINRRGQIVGESAGQAFLWQNGRIKSLGPGRANAINDSSIVAGQGNDRASLWVGEKRRFLPVPKGRNTSEALAINNRGETVGYAGPYAVLWSQGRMIDLDRLLPQSAGWHLVQATGINNSGQIVGNGVHRGLNRAFLLTPATK